MHTNKKRFLFWMPRVLCILLAMFLSVFALDVFSEGYSFGETILALLIHLVPTFLVVIGLVIAWRREMVGAILFIILAVGYLVMSKGESLIILVPLVLVGGLFLLNWNYTERN